jgi:hypothetical protein
MDRSFRQLAQPNDQQPFGSQSRRCVQQQPFVGAGLVFACCKHAGRSRLYRGVGDKQRGLRFSVGAFDSLGVDGQNGQQFGWDRSKGSK